MTTWGLLASTWNWEPTVVAGSALLLLGYLWAVRFRFDGATAVFGAGVGVMLFALVSPLDELGDEYLFSAHMLQHILIDLVAPMLFVLGFPAALAARVLAWRPAAAIERVLGAPAVAWFLGVGTLWVWHLPALYDETLRSEAVHTFEHLTFLVTGTIFFWPALAATGRKAMNPLIAVAYLVLAAVVNSVLGIVFTLAETPFYAGYLHPEDTLGALTLIRQTWGLDPVADQQLGGVFMWAIGSLVFLVAIMVVFVRWYREPDEDAGPGAGAGEEARA